MQLLPRSEAKLLGSKFYLTGKPCRHGHVSPRYTSIGKCHKCGLIASLSHYHGVSKFDNDYRTQATERSRRHHKKVGTKWYHENKDKAAEHNKRWRDANKEAFGEYTKYWRRNNKDKLAKNASLYRASKIRATPLWACQDAIQRFYTEANTLTQETGVVYTVDHIVPLNNELVCGLHVEHNLQIITLIENSSKGNKHG